MRLEARCQSLMLEVEFGSYFLLPKAFFSQPNSFPETLHELVIKFAVFSRKKVSVKSVVKCSFYEINRNSLKWEKIIV